MPRSDRDFVVTCVDGINQQVELAKRNQCADARNVWAPDGRVQSRPGYVGLTAQGINTPSYIGGSTGAVYIKETPAGTYAAAATFGQTLDLADLATGSRWYIGFEDDTGFSGVGPTVTTGFTVEASATNSNSSAYKAEYWNGVAWTYIPVVESASGAGESAARGTHLSTTNSSFNFATPQDWATTSITVGVTTYTKYFLRFTILTAALDASTTLDLLAGNLDVFITTSANRGTVGLFAVQFPAAKRYLFSYAFYRPSVYTTTDYFVNSSSISWGESVLHTRSPGTIGLSEPASIAIVPQFEEAFLAAGNQVTHHKANPASTDTLNAAVETADFAVGPDAPYDPDYIAQLGEFPRAKYIQFFGGRLWAANLKDEPFTVRWSAPAPYHKVWPALSYETLMEHDNSPITGMHPLGEFMVIFKSDSIWMAYDTGVDAFGLQTYAIRLVVAGVGCVSNSSIKAIRGQLIFLAEDGIYSFDGAKVTKLSDPLNDTVRSITPGRRPFAAAAHWRSKSLYLLSVTTDGSNTHNLTLVHDYKNGTWWLWDNIDAQHWLEDEQANDNEALYFGDSAGRIYQMGVGKTDHGGTIDSYITTHRLGYGHRERLRVRAITAMCSNDTRDVTIEVLPNDVTSGTSGTLDFTDDAEKDWSDFDYVEGASTDDNWTPFKRRMRRIDFREECDWFQVKVSHDEKAQPFKLAYIDAACHVVGERRA